MSVHGGEAVVRRTSRDGTKSRARASGEFVLAVPVRPARASGADEVTLEHAVAGNAVVFPGPAHKSFISGTRRHHTRAFPLEKDLIAIRIHDHARAIRVGAPLIDVVHESAIDS